MKETNLLETQLRSWQPRRPSARLKRRLFATPARVMPQMAWLLGWLAPVTACALLTLSLVNSGTGISRGPSRHDPMFAMVLSNQSCAAYVSEDFQAGQNKWSSVTVDWTIRSSATSGASSFLRRRTN